MANKTEKPHKQPSPSVKESDQRLSNNVMFLGRAFALYCKGLSPSKIADVLRPEYPGVHVRMLQRIASECGWEKARAGYLKLFADAQKSSEGMLPEIILNLQRMRGAMEARIGRLTFNEVREYRGLCEDLLWYTGKHPKLKEDGPIALGGDAETEAFTSALMKHKVIGPLLRKHRAEIKSAVEEHLSKSKAKKH